MGWCNHRSLLVMVALKQPPVMISTSLGAGHVYFAACPFPTYGVRVLTTGIGTFTLHRLLNAGSKNSLRETTQSDATPPRAQQTHDPQPRHEITASAYHR